MSFDVNGEYTISRIDKYFSKHANVYDTSDLDSDELGKIGEQTMVVNREDASECVATFLLTGATGAETVWKLVHVDDGFWEPD